MLFKLLALPISGPLAGVEWIGKTIHGRALEALNDPTEIKRKLTELERKLDAGELAEDEFEALENELLLRLKEASKLMRRA
jgi:hypothetical protein